MRVGVRPLILSIVAVSIAAGQDATGKKGVELGIDARDGVYRLYADSRGGDGIARRSLLRVTWRRAQAEAGGLSASGSAGFLTWKEEGATSWTSYTRDGGRTWSRPRVLERALLLRGGAIASGAALPGVPAYLAAPPAGRLFLVQLRTLVLPEWKEAIAELGAEVLSFFPQHAFIVRMDAALAARVASLACVERVAPYHPAYRLDDDLRRWLEAARAGKGEPARRRVRVVALEWGRAGKDRIVRAAAQSAARVLRDGPNGRVLELEVSPEQLERIAADDSVLWIGRFRAAESDMNLVRQDSGAVWLEAETGFCGQGVRGEVMDGGIQANHPDFDGILLHGAASVGAHGTSTYGIVFGNGDRDGDGNAQATGMLPCAEQGIFADHDFVGDRYAETEELKAAPYFASFQSNSWGSETSLDYTDESAEMDDIIWRLDIAITQSQGNTGNLAGRPQAWAKNIISVGGIFHENTLDPADDTWCGFVCSGLSEAACLAAPHCHWDPHAFGSHCLKDFCASIGPASDGRVKPDVSYWFDSIFTTTSGSGYTSDFGGTSAATPQVAGVVGLLAQMWSENVWGTDPAGSTVFERQPHFATLKALLINSAQQYSFSGADADLGRMHQGWGRPSVQNARQQAARSFVDDESHRLTLGQSASYLVDVDPGSDQLKVTMVYPDPPGPVPATLARVNDLDLRVTSPSGKVYYGNAGLDVSPWSSLAETPDAVDTVENVFVKGPETGRWIVEVEAVEINEDGCLPEAWPMDATFALVVTGATRARCEGKECPCVVDADCDDALYCDGNEVCAQGTCQAGAPPCDSDVCHELERSCDFCPATYGCAGSSCQRVDPPQCTTQDTGWTACQAESVEHCPAGTTIHVTRCACHATAPHAFCASKDQSWDCR